ncbi:DNA-binding protein H-NS [Variibacter gotjawalensis]|nr:DNA-binding protein H-NS [Variibacter gotjawalensis]
MTTATAISSLSIEELLDLHSQVEARLRHERSLMKERLETVEALFVERDGSVAVRRGIKPGTRFAPKFRGPGGELWAGRGKKPRWLAAELKNGRSESDFLIDVSLASADDSFKLHRDNGANRRITMMGSDKS